MADGFAMYEILEIIVPQYMLGMSICKNVL